MLKSRLPLIWLSVLTVYQSYVCTDALSTLKTVEANQAYTLKFMEKSTTILKRFKKVRIPGEPQGVATTTSAS